MIETQRDLTYKRIGSMESDILTDLISLRQIVNARGLRKITLAEGESLTLKPSTLYAFLKDGDDNTASLTLDDVVYYEGTEDQLTFSFAVIIIPENTQGGSAEYPPSYYGLALINKAVGTSLIKIDTVSSKKFKVLKEDMERGALKVSENSGSSTFSVWALEI